MSDKRPLSPGRGGAGSGALVVKKARTEDSAVVLPPAPSTSKKPVVGRTSSLEAPIMLLTGHEADVNTLKFSPDGEGLASGGHDKSILLWKLAGACESYAQLTGHKSAILELHWTQDAERLLSCSADKTVRAWDAITGLQVKKMAEHDDIVNSCCPLRRGAPLLVSGGNDRKVKIWDQRVKKSVSTFEEDYQTVAVAFSEAGDQVYAAGIENVINVWDLRKEAVSMRLPGHGDTVTGLRLSPDGSHLLSNSMDNTLRIWDMRPYAPTNRCTKIFSGHHHGMEKNLLKCDWNHDGSRITCGSGDRMVYVWDVNSRRLLYKLPGHLGCVNEATFHPKEPIIGSASSDRQIYLGEISLS